MAARKNKIRHDENTRLKIQTSQLVNRLTDHILGKVELQSTQVTAAIALLKKTLPDLSAVDMNAVINDKRTSTDWSKDELVGFLDDAKTSSERASKANGSDGSTDSVH